MKTQVKVKNFNKSKISCPLPHLLDVQLSSWKRFWDEDLRKILKELSPIRDYSGKKLELWFEDYYLDKPNYDNYFDAWINDDTYEAPLRVKVKLVNLETKEIKEQEVYLCDIPLMTERGTFIVNGVERVTVSQLIRSPGVFFTMNYVNKEKNFGAKIIPYRGAWLEFETEKSGYISVKIDRRRKVPATTLLKAFGLTMDQIKELFSDVDIGEVKYIESTFAKDSTIDQTEALIDIYTKLRPGDYSSADNAKELIFNMFFNIERYDLSEVGRWKMLMRLPQLKKYERFQEEEISMKNRVLTKEDVIETIREIIRMNNNPFAEPDQIDHLGNRRVRTLNELLGNRIKIGLTRMSRIIKDRMSTLDTATLTPLQVINPNTVISVVKEFFSSSQIAQFMDAENPLAELEHKRRVSSTGPGGLTRERAGFEVRDVQPSHYGRICPIQTPEGQNVGLVNYLAVTARINKYGFIEAPYYKVENGIVNMDKVYYMSAFEEEKYIIAHAGVEIDENNRIVNSKVEARIYGEPGLADRKDVQYIDASYLHPISVATSLIPFLRHDDANRALMGSNMQRQAVPLVKPQAPLVGTGMESYVASCSGHVLIAEEDGVVTYVDASTIKIKEKTGEEREYKLKTFVRTNQYTCFHQKPIVKVGDKVKKGDIITDGPAIDKGRLALGANVLVAFMPFRGNTFEDAIVISERLVKNDTFTSIHIENFVCDVRETKLGPEITTPDIPNVSEERLKDLDEEGIVRVGAEVNPGDILVGKISPKGEVDLTPEERLLRAIFGEKAKDVKDTSLLMEHGKRGIVIRVKIFEREKGYKLEAGVIKRIIIEVAEMRKIQAGDKLAGRHGNKGVVAKVLPEEEMPFMEDGTPIDIVLNPLGVVSRMNIGQIFETHLGWAAHKLGYLAETPGLTGAVEEDIKRELKEAGLPEDGKVELYDGRTGEPFPQPITVGYIYMMKLIHMVSDKIHMRSIGPYSLITQQPLGGRAQFGGQRFGEMEVWALEAYGSAFTLQEMLTLKSDDVLGRVSTYEAIIKGQPIKTPNIPSSFTLLVNELKSLAINVIIGGKTILEDESKNN
ncbi:DNA-directed RNA polymerase subunit beta [bacterium HR34]|nr:DNA-directed RNA polymerase subunit beta [bacterium HR34]